MNPEITAVLDRAALARNAAERFVALARQMIARHARFSVALAGGSTPRDLYALLATPKFAVQVEWARAHFFWGDERAVPPEHPDSNFKMAHDALLSQVSIPPENVHRIHGEWDASQAARDYEQTLREFFQVSAAPSSGPAFDLILLGLGANGHTASLFPHTQLLHETEHWVAAEYIAEVKMNRITLTVPAINAAKNIVWLVAGADKAATVRAVLRGAYRPEELPAQLIQPANAQVTWLLDHDAASQI